MRTEELAVAANDVGLAVLDPSDRKTTRIDVGPGGLPPPRARLAFWAAIASGARDVTLVPTAGDLAGVLSLGETAGIVTRNEQLFAPLRSRPRGVREIRGAPRPAIEIKLLESDETVVIVGLNYSASPTRVTIAFDADIPEAIWQNMETGTSVSFLMTEKGPELEHTFAPNDALVLMIRKKLRL